MGAEETQELSSWSLQRTTVRIMWALIIGGIVAAAIGTSGLSAVVAVAVMVAAYFALTAFVNRR